MNLSKTRSSFVHINSLHLSSYSSTISMYFLSELNLYCTRCGQWTWCFRY